MQFLNVSAYKFVDLGGLPELRATLRERSLAAGLKGTILLAPEGINLFLAGVPGQLENFLAGLLADPRFAGMPVKRSLSEDQPFNRMLVKLKREIITMNRPDVQPGRNPAPRLAPLELKKWLDEEREVLLLDTRNQFEVELGTFEGAVSLGLESFSDFPLAVGNIGHKDIPTVAFCTGGIRCEKAAPWLIARGLPARRRHPEVFRGMRRGAFQGRMLRVRQTRRAGRRPEKNRHRAVLRLPGRGHPRGADFARLRDGPVLPALRRGEARIGRMSAPDALLICHICLQLSA